jgi:hypothetical protein
MLPRFAFVLGDRDDELRAARFRRIVDEDPVAVGEADAVDSAAGVRQFGIADRAPVDAVVVRFRNADDAARAVLAHVRDERAVVAAQNRRLNVAEPDEGLARVPRFAIVVADCHDRNVERVGIERKKNAPARQHGRLAAVCPAKSLEERILEFRSLSFGTDDGAARRTNLAIAEQLERFVAEIIGLQKNHSLTFPLRRARTREVGRGPIVHQARFPARAEDRRIEQPEPRIFVDHHAGVAIGKAGPPS